MADHILPRERDLATMAAELKASEAENGIGASLRQPCVLSVSNLTISYAEGEQRRLALSGVSMDIERGQVIGIVGESGSGKSTLAKALLGLLPPEASIDAGEVKIEGQKLASLRKRDLTRIRGSIVSFVPQDPLNGLNPVLSIGYQMRSAIRAHRKIKRAEMQAEIVESLRAVGLQHDLGTLRAYPHEFSGGMRQRILIAMALLNSPSVIVADEPTTALDATVQAQILELLETLAKRREMSIVLISHNVGVVARLCDRLIVMLGGEIVEDGAVSDVLGHPRHPYTMRLVKAAEGKLGVTNVAEGAVLDSKICSVDLPDACRYLSRCAMATDRCHDHPQLEEFCSDWKVRCFVRVEKHIG